LFLLPNSKYHLKRFTYAWKHFGFGLISSLIPLQIPAFRGMTWLEEMPQLAPNPDDPFRMTGSHACSPKNSPLDHDFIFPTDRPSHGFAIKLLHGTCHSSSLLPFDENFLIIP